MNKFDLITFEDTKVPQGVAATVEFPNGWGASIIKNDMKLIYRMMLQVGKMKKILIEY